MTAIATILERQRTADEPSVADFARYAALVAKSDLKPKQADELQQLIAKLGYSAQQVKLHATILQWHVPAQALVSQEREAAAAEQQLFKAEAAARQELLNQEIRARWKREHNEFPEVQAHNAAREKSRLILWTQGELTTVEMHWPELFGLPLDTRPLGSENMPSPILVAMTRLGIPN